MKVFISTKFFEDGRNKDLIEFLSSRLSLMGLQTFSIIRDLEGWGKVELDSQTLMRATFDAINECDAVLIDLSVKGVGIGIEAGYAYATNKIIITVSGDREIGISKSLKGISAETYIYDSRYELGLFMERAFEADSISKLKKLDSVESKLDLLLINSPQYDYSKVPFRPYVSLPPLGLAYISTWLEHKGFAVSVLNGEHHGLSPNSIAQIVNEMSPRFVGINLLTPTYKIASQIIENIDPNITIIVGDSHADALPLEVMKDPEMKKVSYLVSGDGELKVEGILRGIDPSTIPGVAFRCKDEVIFNPDQPLDPEWTPRDLDILPFVDRKFLESEPFHSEGNLEATMIASRDCPFSCSFCAASYNMVRKRPRVRSIPNIIEEMKLLNTRYGVTAIRFVDDLLLGNVPFIREFAKSIIANKVNDLIVWNANARVSLLWKADDEVFDLLAQSGCRQLSIGIESGSQRILDYVTKRITPEQVKILVKRLAKHGIRASGYFIVGFPDETLDEVHMTLDLFHELRALSSAYCKHPKAIFRGNIFEFRPYPRTTEWNRLLEKQYSPEDLLTNYYPLVMDDLDERMKRRWSSGIKFSEVDPSKLQELIRLALLRQNEDLNRLNALPEFAWHIDSENTDRTKGSVTRIVGV